MVFCHRFFLLQSHAKNDKWVSLVGPCRDQAFGLNKSAFDNVVSSDAFCLFTLSLQIIAEVCMFLSAKVESTPVDLKTLIITSEEILHKKVIAAEERQVFVFRFLRTTLLTCPHFNFLITDLFLFLREYMNTTKGLY